MLDAPPASSSARSGWAKTYADRLLLTDAIVIAWAVFGSQVTWFGTAEKNLALDSRFYNVGLSYTVISVALSVLWFAFISAAASRDSRIVGVGATEYTRVINSSLMLFGLVAIAAYLTQAELARGYFLTALPAGLIALLVSRWLWRQYLIVRRQDGRMSEAVILVGSIPALTTLATELARAPYAGYRVVAAFSSECHDGSFLPGTNIPVAGTIDDVIDSMPQLGADTVIVASTDRLSPQKLRELSWSLEPGRQHLVVAPGLVDIAGPRIHTRPVAGLPLIHVETPRYEGSRAALKRGFDIVASAILLAVLSPVLAVVAILVGATSPGSVLYRAQRIGHQGKPFNMLKFRSMRVGADAELAALLAEQGTADKPLFKIKEDPRVTPLGQVLRRFSLDELPQLFNVLNGSMSLVGPRPQIAAEVALYDDAAHRRLLLKPGISGLWQVSGRSNLSWEDAIRLDLSYVENWSLTGDLHILWRTAKAVLARDGAS